MTGAVAPGGHPAAYDVLVGLHVVCVVIGFGSVALSGAYGAIGRHAGRPGARPRPETMTELRRFFSADSRLGWFLLAGPAFGVVAMAVRPGGREFGDLWAVAGLILWVAASALLLAVVRPAEIRLREVVASTSNGGDPPVVAALGDDCRRLMWASAASDLMFVVSLFLMVTQPR